MVGHKTFCNFVLYSVGTLTKKAGFWFWDWGLVFDKYLHFIQRIFIKSLVTG